ncbi:MAG: SulP family inorganic anion transporter [Flavobacteriales bacterium]|nr:SulP family inorganic anion transporter [Flavobacteriales bacterium]
MVEFIKRQTKTAKNDILSGLTVALALVPEAVAFAFVAGVDPLVGLYGAFMMGIITSIFGGRPGMISGATGAMAVVMVTLISEGNLRGEELGLEDGGLIYLLLTLLLVGVIQMAAGFLRLGKFVRLIPHPVMMGFVNGLAIVIFLSQVGMFTEGQKDPYGNPAKTAESGVLAYHIHGNQVYSTTEVDPVFEIKGNQMISTSGDTAVYNIQGDQLFHSATLELALNVENDKVYKLGKTELKKNFLAGKELYLMIALVLLTMAIMYGLPKITTKIPAALAAIVVVASITIFGGSFFMDVSTVGDFITDGGGTGLEGGLPTFQTQIFNAKIWTFDTLWMILPYALILAAVGLIESLMTLSLIDEMTETRGSGNRECVAQGSANFLNGLFGGMGGCAMIGQSIININSGGRGRLSGAAAAMALLFFILWGAPLIEQIPIAALVGVMFMVVIGTFAWSSFRILFKIPKADAFVLILVSVMTVMFDLAIAVITGVIVSALVFSWTNAARIRARKTVKDDGVKVYEIWGPLFFGSIQAFNQKFNIAEDPEIIEIDFIESRVQDHSGVEALRGIVDKYEEAGKKVILKHLSPDCKKLLIKRNIKFEEIIKTDIDDPRYYVVSDTEGIME